MARDFMKVKCGECGNEQNIFSHASREVECLVCGETLAVPRGGRVDLEAELVEGLSPE